MIFYIENIQIELTKSQHGLRLEAFGDVLPLPGQTIIQTKKIITENFHVVKTKYEKNVFDKIPAGDLNEVSLKIVLHYFYLYNSWKSLCEKECERSLAFLNKDFTHPYTYDKIIQHFKNKNAKDYAGQCSAMIGITKDELSKYEADREYLYSMF